jgi:hypothetical protein
MGSMGDSLQPIKKNTYFLRPVNLSTDRKMGSTEEIDEVYFSGSLKLFCSIIIPQDKPRSSVSSSANILPIDLRS